MGSSQMLDGGLTSATNEATDISGEDVGSCYDASDECVPTNLKSDDSRSLISLDAPSALLTEFRGLHIGGSRSLVYPEEAQALTVAIIYYLPVYLGLSQPITELDLSHYTHLRKLPESLTHLKALKKLTLRSCISLLTLPDSLSHLQALTNLNIGESWNLISLPGSLGQLQSLRSLILSMCCSLMTLPDSLGQLQALTILDLSSCHNLNSLPESLGQLGALKTLDLSSCFNLKALPESMGELQALRILDLCACGSLVTLPESLGQLQALTYLDLGFCPNIIRPFPSFLSDLPLIHWPKSDLYTSGWHIPFHGRYAVRRECASSREQCFPESLQAQ